MVRDIAAIPLNQLLVFTINVVDAGVELAANCDGGIRPQNGDLKLPRISRKNRIIH